MSKHKKSKTRIKKSFVIEGLVEPCNVIAAHLPELSGKCSFRIRRVFVSEGVTLIYVEAQEEGKESQTMLMAVQDSVCMFAAVPEFKDAVISPCKGHDGNLALTITKQFIVFGSRVFVFLVEGEIERKYDKLEKVLLSTSMP